MSSLINNQKINKTTAHAQYSPVTLKKVLMIASAIAAIAGFGLMVAGLATGNPLLARIGVLITSTAILSLTFQQLQELQARQEAVSMWDELP